MCCGEQWCGVAWRGVVWCGGVWCGAVWRGVVWCCVAWCGVVSSGVVQCGVVGWGAVRCGVVWCGAVQDIRVNSILTLTGKFSDMIETLPDIGGPRSRHSNLTQHPFGTCTKGGHRSSLAFCKL